MPKLIKVPVVRIEAGAVERMADEVEELGCLRLLVVTGKRTAEIAGKRVHAILEQAGFPTELFLLEHVGASIAHVHTVREKIREGKFDSIVAVGGGSIIDIVKLAAAKEKVELVVVPTAASHDGIASSFASVPLGRGYASHRAMVPGAVIADLDILLNAPSRTLAAGCGDLLAKLSAYEDWRLAHEVKGEEFDEVAVAMTRLPAEYVVHAARAIRDRRPAAIRLVVRGLIVSGLAVEVVGTSRPVSGSEHKFSHALDMLSNRPAMHGEQVAVGTILSLYLHQDHWQRVKRALEIIGAPTTLKALGVDKEIAVRAMLHAPKIRPGRYTIFQHINIDRRLAEEAITSTGVD